MAGVDATEEMMEERVRERGETRESLRGACNSESPSFPDHGKVVFRAGL